MAMGCNAPGATGSQNAESDQSTLSTTATESAELVASFGQESSGSIAASYGLGTQSLSTDAVPPAGVRPELVVALELIAANPKLCSSGTASLTIAPNKTADCADIGKSGSYPGGATMTFAACVLPNGGKLDGSLAVEVTRALASGQTCGPKAQIDVTHQVTMASLSYTSPSDYVLTYSNLSAMVTSTHEIGALPTMVSGSLSGDRKIEDPSGKLILDQSFSGSSTVGFAASMRTINGTFTVVHHLAKYTGSVTLNGIERVETCCRPIAGDATITITPVGGIATQATLSYGPSCGAVALDGKPLTVAECL
jgi:hypothetical protein